MLLVVILYVTEMGGDARTLLGKLYGQEKNVTTASVARMNLLLHGIEDRRAGNLCVRAGQSALFPGAVGARAMGE